MADPGTRGRRHGLRWAAGIAVLAAGAVTIFERSRSRRAAAPAAVLVSGRGRPLAPPTPRSLAHGYETGDADVRRLAIIMVVSITLMLVGVAAVFAMYAAFARHDRDAGEPLTLEQAMTIVPPKPHLQAEPFADIEALQAHQRQMLTTYGWTNPDRKQPHIPIARAMEQVVGKPWDGEPSGAAR